MSFFQSIWLSLAAFFGITVEVPSEQISTDQMVMMEQSGSNESVSEASESNVGDIEQQDMEQNNSEIMKNSTNKIDKSNSDQGAATMLVAGGCFWCVEADLEKLPGVITVVSGYAGGNTEKPNYNNYGNGGHREVVEVTYDPARVSFEDILIVTMKNTDPTDDEGTFADRGDKYSAAFYYENAEQKQIIEALITEVDKSGPYDKPLAIDVEQRATFWPAEDFHQDYYKGTLSSLKYKYYRSASGRDTFVSKYWVDSHSAKLPWRTKTSETKTTDTMKMEKNFWLNYQKPDKETLKASMDAMAFKVTQEDGTERAGTSALDKNYEAGIYVDVLSGEPLYSSRDKFDSGTGWPSFVKPIRPDALTEHEDKKLFSVRTETRSAIADNHIGHVFNDGPADRGGLRYCMNGVALEFVPKAEMLERGYGDYLGDL